MSQVCKFDKKFRISSFENREVEITLPAYRKYYGEGWTWYVKLYNNENGQLCDVTISVTDDHYSDSGAQINKSFEIEFENPHRFGYSYDFYMGNGDASTIIDEAEFTKVVAQIVFDMLGLLGVKNDN